MSNIIIIIITCDSVNFHTSGCTKVHIRLVYGRLFGLIVPLLVSAVVQTHNLQFSLLSDPSTARSSNITYINTHVLDK
jgi:hypothetical protein